MLAKEAATGSDEKNCAIQRATIPFDHADHQMGARYAGNLSETIDGGAGHVHGALAVAPKPVSTLRRPGTDTRPEVSPLWVTADKGLGKDDQFGALGGGAGSQLRHPVD